MAGTSPDLMDALHDAVRRRLSFEERLELRRRVSDRLREIVPYSEEQEDRLASRLDRMSEEVLVSTVAPLSVRESMVLAHMLLGLSNDEIAAQLAVSMGTVQTQVKAVLRKLGARNRVHAVALALTALSPESTIEPAACGAVSSAG